MLKQTLENFADTGTWDVIKKELIIPLLEETKDVTQPLLIDDIKINAKEAYLAKILAARKFNTLIGIIDKHKNSNRKNTNTNFE
jgi:hypothetical protein|tara:strand:- start:85 stop:336 length:252 start_codon:yes stop_codon:yes gene_type:complete